ncbi:MAG: IS1380 family transposase [Nitrospira sp.]|nr:MAG: IS1380 family transposase [Nitrospira sp.]
MGRQTVFGFKLERTEEPVTAHGGLALLAEFNHGLGLCGLVDRYLPGPGSNRGDAPSVFVDRLILMLQAGGRCLEDLRALTREVGLMRRLDREAIPDPDTLGDWLQRMGEARTGPAGLVGLGQVRDVLNARLLRRDGDATYTLDADATLIEAEKREAQWRDQQVRGSMPMLGFLFETPVCLVDEFRAGNVSPGAGPLAFYRACKARLPQGKRSARDRADRASYQAELVNALEADQAHWAITADQDVAVKAVIAGLTPAAWQEPEPGGGDQVAEAGHTMTAAKAAFRLIIKREARRQRELFDEGTTPSVSHVVARHGPVEEKTAHEGLVWHHQRGQAENFHKELKHGLGLEPLPCGEAGANAVFFRIGVLAYHLFIGFKRLACPAAWAPHTIATIRWRLVQGAGRILRHAGRVVLRLGLDAETLVVWHGIRQRCWTLGGAP